MEQKQTQLKIDLNKLSDRLCPECQKIFLEEVGRAVLVNAAGMFNLIS